MVIAEREKDDVPLVDPDFFAQFAADVGKSLGAVEAEGFETPVAEHFEDLCVFYGEDVSVIRGRGDQLRRGERKMVGQRSDGWRNQMH